MKKNKNKQAEMLRLFVAIEISKEIRDSLAALQEELRITCPEIRWVKPENIHLTLKFLGNVKEALVPEILHSLSRALLGLDDFVFEVKGTGAFPAEGRPRVMWVGISQGADKIFAFHSKIKQALASFDFEEEKNEFAAHLTIGRLKDEVDTEKLKEMLVLKKDKKFGECACGHISIIKSDLRPEGPVYTILEKIKL